MVPNRCAMAKTVYDAKTSRIMVWIFASVRTSTDAVHSSCTHAPERQALGLALAEFGATHHHEDLGVAEHSACEAEQLALADGQSIAAVAHVRVQLLRYGLDRVPQLRLVQRVPKPVIVMLGKRVQVLPDRARKQRRVLRQHRDGSGQSTASVSGRAVQAQSRGALTCAVATIPAGLCPGRRSRWCRCRPPARPARGCGRASASAKTSPSPCGRTRRPSRRPSR